MPTETFKPQLKNLEGIQFPYNKIEEIIVDLHNAKEDAEENLIKVTVTKYGFIEGEWIEIPRYLDDSEEFKKYIVDNFEDEPIINEENDTQIFKRKQKELVKTEEKAFVDFSLIGDNEGDIDMEESEDYDDNK